MQKLKTSCAFQNMLFLYDNQNLIRETFISEIDKKVNFIGSISFFDKVEANNEMFLIKNKNKLKFDFNKNATMVKLSFNISPTKANKKIKLKKKRNEKHYDSFNRKNSKGRKKEENSRNSRYSVSKSSTKL